MHTLDEDGRDLEDIISGRDHVEPNNMAKKRLGLHKLGQYSERMLLSRNCSEFHDPPREELLHAKISKLSVFRVSLPPPPPDGGRIGPPPVLEFRLATAFPCGLHDHVGFAQKLGLQKEWQKVKRCSRTCAYRVKFALRGRQGYHTLRLGHEVGRALYDEKQCS